MDMHRPEYLQVGSAKVRDVIFGVQSTGRTTRYMLVGLTFIGKFRTIFDLDGCRVLFRSRNT
jgi:hypothetical protein